MYYYIGMVRLKNIFNKIAKNRVLNAIFSTIGKIARSINHNRIYNKGAELAYYMVIGILTMLATVVYAAHFIPNLIQNLNTQVLVILPDNVSELILNALLEIKVPQSIPVIIATSVTSVWFVSRAMHSIMTSFNEIYHVKEHKIGLKSRVFSVAFTLALVLMFLVIFAFNIIQASLSELAETYLKWSMDFFEYNAFWQLLISTGILLFIFNALYYYLPDRKLRWYYSLPGAAFSTATWMLMSKGFTLYITSISSFSWILGSFGSLFVFLIWIYYSAIFLLMGAVINSKIMQRMETQQRIKEECEKAPS